ncbi:MAG: OmpA family protein [Leucothrix sp.]
MNKKTTKQFSLLFSFALLAACSSQNTTNPGSQSRLGGQSASNGQSNTGGQSIPGSQLLNRQNNDKPCIDKTTGKVIPGCKPPKMLTSTTKVNKLPTAPKTDSKMRKIVLKAPKRTIAPVSVAKPTMAKPFSSTNIAASTPKTQPSPSASKVMSKPTPTTLVRTVTKPVSIQPVMTKPMPMPMPALTRPAITAPIPARPVINKPTPVKPVVTQPYNTGIIANPVRSAKPTRPAIKPVRAPKKPQSTLRRLTLNGSANFKSGSSRLTSAGQTKLLALSLSLQEGNTTINRLLIEGHTDSVGNAAMNQVLSLRRANAVADFLAKQGGFARSMMETAGLGESKPVANNKTRKGRAQNRRVEIAATGTRRINR